MGFYGIRQDYDSQLAEIAQKIERMQQERAASAYTDLVLPRQVNLSSVGGAILGGVLSGQYAGSLIAAYLHRQWLQPALTQTQPLTDAYAQLPPALTQAKAALADFFSQRQRLALTNLLALAACATSLRPSALGLLHGAGKGAVTFCIAAWALLPELGAPLARWL